MTDVEIAYKTRYADSLFPIAEGLQRQLNDILADEVRIDRISTRPKSVERFMAKANKLVDGRPKYNEPLFEIQDQIGARIITFYQIDVARVSQEVLRYFRAIESRQVVPEREWEFGYFGQHHILLIPDDVIPKSIDRTLVPSCFELQIKTLFQHAWSEANHDLGYKPGELPLEADDLRQLAYTSAQAWGADRIFCELFQKREAMRK